MGKLFILCLCFCAEIGILLTMFFHNRHPPRGMQGMEGTGKGWLRFFYSSAYVIHCFLRKKLLLEYPEEKIEKLQQIEVRKSREELEEFYDCQRMGGILFLVLLTLGVTMLSIMGENGQQLLQSSYFLMRGDPGEGTRQVELQVKTEGEEKQITVLLPERQYSREELKAKFAEAREYIKKTYLGKNQSAEKIVEPLCLVSTIPDSQIKVSWKLDSNGYVNKDGTLNNKDICEKTEILLVAVLSYEQEKQRVTLEGIIYPKKRTKQEQFWENWKQEMEQNKEETAQENTLLLPREINGKAISYQEVTNSVWYKFLLAGLLLCVLLPSLLDYQTEQRIRKREQQLKQEYPEMIERFILLIGAGMTIRGAWCRITRDYEERCQKEGYGVHYLYEEMLITQRELENGQNESVAYAAFGRRLSLLPYMKFSTLLVQNLKKGSDDLLKKMDMEAVDALRERREMAKKLGEEARTKLLFPMLIMLSLVFALILIAAFQNL